MRRGEAIGLSTGFFKQGTILLHHPVVIHANGQLVDGNDGTASRRVRGAV